MQFQRYYGFSLKYDIVMGDNMSRQMIEFFTAWGFSVFSWAVALFFWILTYVVAPIQSRKSGKHVSGFPGVAFVFCILAGVLSPCKWLVLLCLSDSSGTSLPFFLLRKYIRDKKDK